MKTTRLFILALLALLAAAAPASAAVTPRFLGTGHDPGVAVDRSGTAHVAWVAETAGGQEVAEYCQVPRRGRTCTVRRTFVLSDWGTAKAHVITGPHPGWVMVIVPVFQEPAMLFRSTDGGNTFVPVPLGEFLAMERVVYGPGDSLSIINGGSVESAFGRYGLDGSGPPGPSVAFGDAIESLDRDLTRHGAGLAAFIAGSGGMRTILWNGLGDPNAQESWVEGPRLNGNRTSPTPATGRSGTFVAYVDRRGRRSDTSVRRLRGRRLLRPRRVSREDPTDLAMAQGPRGDLALVWPDADDTWFVRSRKGRRWTRPRRLVRGSDPGDVQAALGPRGGFIVWDGSPGNMGEHPIRIARIPPLRPAR